MTDEEELKRKLEEVQQEVGELKGEVSSVKQDVTGLNKLVNEILDRLKSAAGHLFNIGKGKGGGDD